MSAAALASGPPDGGVLDHAPGSPAESAATAGAAGKPGFEFALRPEASTKTSAAGAINIDRLIEQLALHARDPASVREAAGSLRRTVVASLWQSAGRDDDTLPRLHARLLGRASALFAADALERLASRSRWWLTILCSPRHLWWAIQAACRGDDPGEKVREKAAWHRVDEIAVFEREARVPFVRVGGTVPVDEADWTASHSTSAFSGRHLVGTDLAEDSACNRGEDEATADSLVVVGERCELVARVSGCPPPAFRDEMQTLCAAADAVLADREAGRAEWVFRIRQIVMPALTASGPPQPGRTRIPRAMLILLLIVAGVFVGTAVEAHLRWRGVARHLALQPGIEVLSSSLAWGRRQLTVLRDRRAEHVAALLRRMGVDPASVTLDERPFVSADPRLSPARRKNDVALIVQSGGEAAVPVLRADPTAEVSRQVLADVRLDMLRSVLDLPAGLEMTLADGTLSARGALAEPAYSRLAHAPARLAWLKKMDLGQVRDLTAEKIAALRDSIVKVRLEFLPASAALPEASSLRLQSAAADLGLLAQETRLKAQEVRLQFRARHPEADESVIAARVESVSRELVRRGVPEPWVRHSLGLLDAEAPNTLSFHLNLEPPTTGP